MNTLLHSPLKWISRHEGSGTQRYLREILVHAGLDQRSLYKGGQANSDREAAALISMGQGDIAPGPRSTANEFGLGFVPFGWEAFDIAMRRGVYFRHLFQELIKRLQRAEAHADAHQLGGYDLGESGELVFGEH